MASAKPAASRQSSRHHRETTRYKKELRLLGENVRSMRHAADWTLETAAEHCDLDWRYLQKIEAGSLNFTFVTLVRLAVGFRVPLHELLTPREGAALEPRRAGRPRKKKTAG